MTKRFTSKSRVLSRRIAEFESSYEKKNRLSYKRMMTAQMKSAYIINKGSAQTITESSRISARGA
jgi:hypothetical protein